MEEIKGRGKLVEAGHKEYGSMEGLRNSILHRTIVKADKNNLVLDNGVNVTIECSESDCCAGGGGEFEFDKWGAEIAIDALITDFKINEPIDVPDGDTIVRRNTITIYHNQNPVVLANAQTDAGNGGYYYSVTSLVVGDVHFPFVDA